ncbi:hypothetical protein Purlil1_7907 [Purpureocillium lilacinum]|uniref:HPt domain-containing protein n=2 Tax=Purpureocillium lilacinum TaxID=33203 RepID=A0ABR0BV01_PURLI|nr:hypothetical protein Purlil1_7907 [Purpureocillium lilacinum]
MTDTLLASTTPGQKEPSEVSRSASAPGALPKGRSLIHPFPLPPAIASPLGRLARVGTQAHPRSSSRGALAARAQGHSSLAGFGACLIVAVRAAGMARAGWHAVPGAAWARLEMPLFLLPDARDREAGLELPTTACRQMSPLLLIRCLDPPEPSNRHATAASLLTPPSGPLRPILEAHHPLTFAAHRRCSSSSLASTHTLLALPTQQPPSRRCAGQSQAQGGIAILLERRPCLPSSPNGSRSSNILPSSYTLSRPPLTLGPPVACVVSCDQVTAPPLTPHPAPRAASRAADPVSTNVTIPVFTLRYLTPCAALPHFARSPPVTRFAQFLLWLQALTGTPSHSHSLGLTPPPASTSRGKQHLIVAMAPSEDKVAPEESESNFGDGVDMSTFNQILEMDEPGDQDFSSSIVFGFFDQAQETFESMDKALKDEDLEKLSQLGHFLKGSSATLGLVKVRDGCEKIQRFGKNENEDGTEEPDSELCLKRIKQALKAVKADYEVVEKALRKYYEGDKDKSDDA